MPDTHSEDKSEAGSVGGFADLEELRAQEKLDFTTFEQILEMDDDEDDREFSLSIVSGFFEQAENTFEEMETALKEKDLSKLSSLGHFLKGSSATLGLIKVRDCCEQIQHYGQNLTADGNDPEPDNDVCLDKIKDLIVEVKEEYEEVAAPLRKFYNLD